MSAPAKDASKSAAPAAPASGAQAGAKVPIMILLPVVMVAVWLGLAVAGGGAYLLLKSGKLKLAAAGEASSAAGMGGTRAVVIEPILVNLADPGGRAYLRLGVTLDLTDAAADSDPKASDSRVSDSKATDSKADDSKADDAKPEAKDGQAKEGEANETQAKPEKRSSASAASINQSALRDILLAVLGEQTSTSLLGPDGKEHLKLELEDALRHREPALHVKDVFFTDFLVQI